MLPEHINRGFTLSHHMVSLAAPMRTCIPREFIIGGLDIHVHGRYVVLTDIPNATLDISFRREDP